MREKKIYLRKQNFYSMLYKYGDKGFKYAWLDYLNEDPIHPSIGIDKRITGSRTVFVLVEDKIPQFIVCARIGKFLPHTISEVLADEILDNETANVYAVFYSIFRTPDATLKGGGALAIEEIIEYCKQISIKRFYTLSPIPFLSTQFKSIPKENEIRAYLESKQGPVEKFHLNNGATISTINYFADNSPKRTEESWGIMVNYNYCMFHASDSYNV